MEQRSPAVVVHAATPATNRWRRETLLREWGGTWVARMGVLIDAASLSALVATIGGEPAGLATYSAVGDDWEVVTVHAEVRGAGVGSALLHGVEDLAEADGAQRVWLITTNNNTGALRFYQKAGYDLVGLYRDAVTNARATLKPQIPTRLDGMDVRHELELERGCNHDSRHLASRSGSGVAGQCPMFTTTLPVAPPDSTT